MANEYVEQHDNGYFIRGSFYIRSREAVDLYLAEGRREFESLRKQSREENPALYANLDERAA